MGIGYIQSSIKIVLFYIEILSTVAHQLRSVSCPYKCECYQDEIFCDNLGFRNIPSNLPMSTRILDMRLNNVTQLRDELWDLDELQTFDLSYNKLYRITNHAFVRNQKLQDLQLEGNNLTIGAFSPKDWGRLPHLKSLNVAQNHLGPILTAGMFNKLTSLQILDLSDNQITTLPSRTFYGLRSLNHLILTSNQLSHVPALALKSLQGLQTLDLSENPIKQLDKKSFSLMISLDALLLKSMGNLTDIADETFSCLPKLRVIEITMCSKLIHISMDSFKGLTNIQLVYLNGNHLQHLNKELLPWDSIPNNGVSLYNNPWICDCNIKWMISDIVGATLNKKDLIRCSAPAKLKGLQLSTIHPNQLDCVDETHHSYSKHSQTANKPHSQHNNNYYDRLTGDPEKDYERQTFPKAFAIAVPTFICLSLSFLLIAAYYKRTRKQRQDWLLRSYSYGSLQKDNYACTASNMDIPYENPANVEQEK